MDGKLSATNQSLSNYDFENSNREAEQQRQQILKKYEQSNSYGQIQINKVNLHLYCFCLGMFMMQLGWTICGNNQPSFVIQQKLGYSDDEYKNIYNPVITSSSILGICIGALVGGQIVKNARRKYLVIFGYIAVIATGLTLIQEFVFIVVGRFIFGFCSGIFMIIAPRMLDETVPTHLINSFGVYTNIYANLGVMTVLLLGAYLPNDTDIDALKNDQFWRVCYGFPLLTLSIGLILLHLKFQQDSIVFLIATEQKQKSLIAIQQVYQENQDFELIYQDIKKNTNIQSSGVSFKQALTHPNYAKASWICFVLSFFHQNTGLNAINMYSAQMVKDLKDFFISPSQATYLVGICGFLGAISGPSIISRTPRKLNFLIGQMSMGISMILMGIFKISGQNILLFIFVCMYAVLFQTSQGPLIWIYSQETTVDSASGLIVLGIFGFLFIQSLTIPSLMNSFLQPQGVFFIFGAIDLIGFFYVLFFLKDTTGLTDKEKKRLYIQKSQINQQE